MADVRGANAAGSPWVSVLVTKTGVARENCDKDPAQVRGAGWGTVRRVQPLCGVVHTCHAHTSKHLLLLLPTLRRLWWTMLKRRWRQYCTACGPPSGTACAEAARCQHCLWKRDPSRRLCISVCLISH